ncbi:AAA family ATPase [Pseudobutyrivibrio xylanivorans]|uniref:AAA domain-containing protein, putative AbiEii toxin, Type IV TA system n=1 Tax=Pseudobutyrivibrio xylanivorans DSM 14809 TaxID=1123012 RepID=A0A1M6JEB9_PSEXY|nr:AAA family ATPase [Pseudobutyrivibrio xylanivorans]SHJ45063.1 AAA domain-containing protein, putative AbiEii toxin, Type IV TA system [Pseudobutyrivibrio xylanivorans DSM 14809]
MEKILIENLGPIKHFETFLESDLYTVIGEQASGKSTIAKSIFFFKSIGEEFEKFLMDELSIFAGGEIDVSLISFKKRLRTKFIELFGTTKHMMPFKMKYVSDNDEIVISLRRGYANIAFSKELSNQCYSAIMAARDYAEMMTAGTEMADFGLWIKRRDDLSDVIKNLSRKVFKQEYVSIFVPAGRSILATNSEFFHAFTPNKYDILMNDFIERIRLLQKQYSQSLEDIVEDRKKLSTVEIDFDSVKRAKSLVRKILKGDYINDQNGERIYYDGRRYVKLIQASSGQQEVLWIVLLLFSIILNKQKVFLTIEEPEAHVFPNAQKDIIELIALMINSTDSTVVLTTHSPYVLTAENLLMYSSKVEGDSELEKSVVDRKYRIDYKKVQSYLIKNQEIENIMDYENAMIDATKIDEVSMLINESLDKLLDLEEN